MAATNFAVLAKISGTSWANAFPQVGGPAQNLDILQIVDDSGLSVLLNVDYAGVVHNPASNPTVAAGNSGATRLGQFRVTGLDSSATTAQLFANVFFNPSLQDIIQVVSPTGGSIVNYIDYQGVSH